MKSQILAGFSEAGLVSYLKARQYDALYWPTFFPLLNVNSLDGKTIIGASGNRVAAHVISYDSRAPEAGRKSFTTQHFDIPKTAQSRRKTEKEILDHEITRALRGNDAVLEDYFNDVDFVFDSVQARSEWMALTAMSTTQIQLTTTNNPQGFVNETVVDFGMPAANKKLALGAVWSLGNYASITPIADFKAVLKAARAKGITFQRILMNSDAFDMIVASTEFTNACKSLLIGESTVLGMIGPDVVNSVLKALRLPEITLIDTYVGIEAKSGAVTATNPWSTTHVLFIPQINLGSMYNGPIAEEIEKPPQVIQAKRGNVLISVQKDFNPVSVLTKGEANCFPAWPTIDRCFNLYTGSTSAWAV